MADALVLDASAALAIALEEREAAAIGAQVRAAMTGDARILVPEHFWLEVVNVLVTRYRHSADDVIERLRVLDEFAPETVPIDRALLLLALERALGHGLAVYDAAYLALAEAQDADLLTLDVALARAAGPRALVVGLRRLSEAPAPYETRTKEAVWARYGAYLAELRKAALAG